MFIFFSNKFNTIIFNCLVLLFIVNLNAENADGTIYNYQCGDNCYWEIQLNNNSIVNILIPYIDKFKSIHQQGTKLILKSVTLNYESETFFHEGAGENITRNVLQDYKFSEMKSLNYSTYENASNIGKDIAEGINLSIITGLSITDKNLKYLYNSEENKSNEDGEIIPILNITLKIESSVLKNMTIEYDLYLTLVEEDNTVIGTIKNISIDNDYNSVLTYLNNKMFVETDDGTHQVLWDGSDFILAE